jgi:hypothetical protein
MKLSFIAKGFVYLNLGLFCKVEILYYKMLYSRTSRICDRRDRKILINQKLLQDLHKWEAVLRYFNNQGTKIFRVNQKFLQDSHMREIRLYYKMPYMRSKAQIISYIFMHKIFWSSKNLIIKNAKIKFRAKSFSVVNFTWFVAWNIKCCISIESSDYRLHLINKNFENH